MNNTNQPSTGNSIMDLLLNSRGQAVQQTFNNLYNNTPAGQAIQARQNLLAQVNPTINSTVAQDLKDPNVNPTGILNTANTGFAGNAELTSGLLGQLLNAATSNVNSNTQTAGSIYNNQQNNATQNRGLSLQYGENDPNGSGVNGTGVNGMDAVSQVQSQGGSSILNGLSQPEQYKMAQKIIAAGGVAKYLHSSPNAAQLHPEDLHVLSNLNNALSLGYNAYSQLDNSPKLKNVIDSSTKKWMAQLALDAGHPETLKTLFGLDDKDITALQNMESLSKNSIAGGAGISIGLNNTSGGNIAALKKLNQLTYNQAKSLANHYGYGGPEDVPGFSSLGGQ